VAAALVRSRADVTLVNRGLDRGLRAASRLNVPFIPLTAFRPAGFSVVVNATPVGRQEGESPFAAEDLDRDAVVVDLVYGPRPTDLLSRARASGRVTVDGREVLLAQVRRQFRVMTGRRLPAEGSGAAGCGASVPDGAVPIAVPV
jgi:shikimate 5-dehydrogenase